MAAIIEWERDTYFPAGFAVRVVNTIIGLIEGALVLRIVLKLLAANPSAQFVAWVYEVTDRLLGPFAGALPVFVVSGSSVFELSVVLAIIGYSILGWLIVLLLNSLFSSTLFVRRSEHPTMPLRGL